MIRTGHQSLLQSSSGLLQKIIIDQKRQKLCLVHGNRPRRCRSLFPPDFVFPFFASFFAFFNFFTVFFGASKPFLSTTTYQVMDWLYTFIASGLPNPTHCEMLISHSCCVHLNKEVGIDPQRTLLFWWFLGGFFRVFFSHAENTSYTSRPVCKHIQTIVSTAG